MPEKMEARPIMTWSRSTGVNKNHNARRIARARPAPGVRNREPSQSVNFFGHEGKERVRAAYGEQTYQKLVAVKGRYDPTNLFRMNQNVLSGAQLIPR